LIYAKKRQLKILRLTGISANFSTDKQQQNMLLGWTQKLSKVPHLNCALFHGICKVPYTKSSRLFFSLGPGLGAPLNNYLEVVPYKLPK